MGTLNKIQEGQRYSKRRVAQAAIRLATAVITFRNKERNVRSPSYGECVRHAKKCKTCNLGYIIVSIYAINRQTTGGNYTIFERNLAVMVIYVPVKFEFDWKKRF